MFGNKNRMSSDEIQEMKNKLELGTKQIQDVAKAAEILDTNMSELKESSGRTGEYVSQMSDNVSSIVESAKSNIEIEATLIHSLEEYGESIGKTEDDITKLVELVEKQNEDAQKLVDGNKHFTSPSKYLSEVPISLRDVNQKYAIHVGKMTEYCKQMGVLALNSAIEAGRMGESGKVFVNSCEVIRTYATNYETEIALMKEEISNANEQIAHLEEQIHHLVGLLKDNNVATAKLMKQCGETNEFAKKLEIGISSDELLELKKNMVDVKNAEEEILKSGERNRMQIEDMETEIDTQQHDEEEIDNAVLSVLKTIGE